MLIGENILSIIMDAVFGFVIHKNSDKLGASKQGKVGRDPIKKAFIEALGQTFAQLEQKYRSGYQKPSRSAF